MSDPTRLPADPSKPPGKRAAAVHIDADEVHVESAVELPEGHVIVEPPTAATPAVARPSTDVRDAQVAAESEASLAAAGRRATAAVVLQGQQGVNKTWELTQAAIALGATATGLGVFATSALIMLWVLVTARADSIMLTTALAVVTLSLNALSSVLFLVVGFYFGRTNHQKIGGVGPTDAGR